MSVGQWGCCVNKTDATVPTFLSGDNNRLQTRTFTPRGLKSILIGKASYGGMFSSVQSQSCLTLCNPMNCSTPGLLVHHEHNNLK